MRVRRIESKCSWLEVEEGIVPYEKQINTSDVASGILRDILDDEIIENFVVILLDARNKVLGITFACKGTANSCMVHPREIFGPAIRESAVSIIVSHNHPSGDPTPSREDIAITRKLVDAGALLGIPVLDHIIVGYERTFSFASNHSELMRSNYT